MSPLAVPQPPGPGLEASAHPPGWALAQAALGFGHLLGGEMTNHADPSVVLTREGIGIATALSVQIERQVRSDDHQHDQPQPAEGDGQRRRRPGPRIRIKNGEPDGDDSEEGPKVDAGEKE